MISAPEASWASFMISIDEYLPVPTIRREENSLPPRTRFVSFMALPPTHRSHDFHLVARVEPRRRVGALGRDLAVHRDGRVLARDAQVRQQRLHADALRDLALFAVHRDLHPSLASRRASPSLRGRRSARTATKNKTAAPRRVRPYRHSRAVFPSPALPGAGSRGPGPHPVLRNPPPTTTLGVYHSRYTASVIALTAAGFSSDERSPGSLPRYVARITRRMILALRVFGRSR